MVILKNILKRDGHIETTYTRDGTVHIRHGKCKRFYILPHNLICFLFDPDFGSPDKEHNDSL